MRPEPANKMKIALAQIECRWGDHSGNIKNIKSICRNAAQKDTQLVVFPELTIQGIVKLPGVKDLAESIDGESVRQISAIASEAGLAIGFGFIERAEPLPFNAYCIVNDKGSIVCHYRKNYIPKLEIPFWQGYDNHPVFEFLGHKCALAICWDATNKDLIEYYASQGVELLILPHGWDADPLDVNDNALDTATMDELQELQKNGLLKGWKTHDQMKQFFLSYIPEYSRKHGMEIVFINQAGQPHPCLKFEGPSFVINRAGEIVAQSRDGNETILYCDLDLEQKSA